jgi:hypothetical protein
MSWETPKTDWVPGDVPHAGLYRRVEGNTLVVREQANLPLCLEVRSSYPAHSVGRAFFHTVDKKIYTSTGTGWV